jgi:formylglycine-generating enzyme required for sulfatase activity/nucleoside phosphorylase/tRNA A-37 threonylcarbamoyl transferase component Bud32
MSKPAESEHDLFVSDADADRPSPTVGILTALPHETAAVRTVLGEPPPLHVAGAGAGRTYWLARLPSTHGGEHQVIVAQADMGNHSAAIRASLLLAHFPSVESIVMCGIAGGIPNPTKAEEHVRLGDVVVSNQKGVVQYDFVKRTGKRKRVPVAEEVRAAPRPPSATLLEAVRVLEADRYLGRFPWEAPLRDGLVRRQWARPDDTTDRLTDAADPAQLLAHPADGDRRPGQPRVFLAAIASANMLLKDPARRDALRAQFGTRAVEMEGSGIADATWNHGIGYLVVRGICDYCDSNKNDDWQKYAAMAAAAYVRALLASMPGVPHAAKPPPPRPEYGDEYTRQLGEEAEELRKRRRGLLEREAAAAAIAAVDSQLRELKRKLRDGPRLLAGECLSDRFKLLEEIGQGGFATVWRAYDEEADRVVAVKVLHGQYADSSERRERFQRGARAMYELAHPHIVRVLELAREDRGYHYFVMEYLGGGTFLEAVTAGKLAQEQIGRVILQIGEALAYAHAHGQIHRDVTPDNILLDSTDGTAKLTDFDLVRLAESSGGTRTGAAVGKFSYGAPECMDGAADVDARCDVYSLGMTALCGFHGKRLPRIAVTRQESFLKQLALSDGIKAVLAQAIAHEREERFRSVEAFSTAFQAAFAKPAPAPAAAGGKPDVSEWENGLGMRFVLVPAGTFWMGGGGGEPGTRQETIESAFYLGKYSVTQGQWQAVMGSNPTYFSRRRGGASAVEGISDADLEQFPVECVSWEDARAFVRKLNEREKDSGFLYSLPTEAEWEYACRGGASSKKACSFHFYLDQPTNALSSTQANFDGNYPDGGADQGPYLGRTSKVGSYAANCLGLYDMHGNVWEWCADRREPGASARVLRGGSWIGVGRGCRSAGRGRSEPGYRARDCGFRLAAVPGVGAEPGEAGSGA